MSVWSAIYEEQPIINCIMRGFVVRTSPSSPYYEILEKAKNGYNKRMEIIMALPVPVFWFWISGLVFLCATVILLVGPFRHDRSDLMNAFLSFLVGMTLFHLLGGAALYWNIPILMYVATLSTVTGSAFVLKFPLSSIMSERVRNRLFYIALIIGWGMVAWLLLNSFQIDQVMAAGAIYMIIVSGAISGFYMLIESLKIGDPATRIKCVGGGSSIILCCLIAHLVILAIGFTILAQLFLTLTPLTLILSIYVARLYATPTYTA